MGKQIRLTKKMNERLVDILNNITDNSTNITDICHYSATRIEKLENKVESLETLLQYERDHQNLD